MSRIEEIINEMQDYIDGCKPQAFSKTNIIVEKEIMVDFISELRMKTPSEIKKYKKIIDNRDEIISVAKNQADEILAQAQAQTEVLINEHEIMQRAVASANEYVQQAQAEAQEILNRATMEANAIKTSAVGYTDDLLAELQAIIEHTIDTSKYKFESFIQELNNSRNIVISNRQELSPAPEAEVNEEPIVDEVEAEPEFKLMNDMGSSDTDEE